MTILLLYIKYFVSGLFIFLLLRNFFKAEPFKPNSHFYYIISVIITSEVFYLKIKTEWPFFHAIIIFLLLFLLLDFLTIKKFYNKTSG